MKRSRGIESSDTAPVLGSRWMTMSMSLLMPVTPCEHSPYAAFCTLSAHRSVEPMSRMFSVVPPSEGGGPLVVDERTEVVVVGHDTGDHQHHDQTDGDDAAPDPGSSTAAWSSVRTAPGAAVDRLAERHQSVPVGDTGRRPPGIATAISTGHCSIIRVRARWQLLPALAHGLASPRPHARWKTARQGADRMADRPLAARGTHSGCGSNSCR